MTWTLTAFTKQRVLFPMSWHKNPTPCFIDENNSIKEVVRQIYNQTDRQTDRETDRQTDRRTDRERITNERYRQKNCKRKKKIYEK